MIIFLKFNLINLGSLENIFYCIQYCFKPEPFYAVRKEENDIAKHNGTAKIHKPSRCQTLATLNSLKITFKIPLGHNLGLATACDILIASYISWPLNSKIYVASHSYNI